MKFIAFVSSKLDIILVFENSSSFTLTKQQVRQASSILKLGFLSMFRRFNRKMLTKRTRISLPFSWVKRELFFLKGFFCSGMSEKIIRPSIEWASSCYSSILFSYTSPRLKEGI